VGEGCMNADRPTTSQGRGHGIIANPLVSRGKPVFASSGLAVSVNTGAPGDAAGWNAKSPTVESPAWLAMQVGVGPSRVLLSWRAASHRDGDASLGAAPVAYALESSADSTNGRDGSWRLEASVADNVASARAHSFEFDGRSWVRLSVTRAPDEGADVRIHHIDVHDASDGTEDTWIFLDRTRGAAGCQVGAPLAAQGFAQLIHAEYPGYYPAVVEGGGEGELGSVCIALPGLLARYPDYRHFALAYGAEEALTGQRSPGDFAARLQSMISLLLSAERVPVLARLAFASEAPSCNSAGYALAAYNEVIDGLTAAHALLRGPDLPASLQTHPEQLGCGAEPAASAHAAHQRLWAQALDPLYVPQ
jgi:acyl-CoA thioesterase I